LGFGAASAFSTPVLSASPAPTASASPGRVRGLPAGLRCADLHAKGFSYGDAVAYWRLHGKPPLMDADHNGIPCETVYPRSAVAAVWGTRAGAPVCTAEAIGQAAFATLRRTPHVIMDGFKCDGPWAYATASVDNLDEAVVLLRWTNGSWHVDPTMCTNKAVPADIHFACTVD
jgi:hypothetical protein